MWGGQGARGSDGVRLAEEPCVFADPVSSPTQEPCEVCVRIRKARGARMQCDVCWSVSLLQVSKELKQLKDINVELAYDGMEIKVKL